jgi:hypothetical protein
MRRNLKLLGIIGVLLLLASCTKRYKCMRYKGAYEVTYKPKEQSCYYNSNGQTKQLTKEQCASLCREDY